MSKPCLVCNATHLQTIDILRHPEKLDHMLKCFLGLQDQQDDYICNNCCNDVINAFDSKQKFHQLSLFEPKVLKSDEKIVSKFSCSEGGFVTYFLFLNEDENDPDVLSDVSKVQIEPKKEDLEYANDGTIYINYDDMMMADLDSRIKLEPGADQQCRLAPQCSAGAMAGGKRGKNYSRRPNESGNSGKYFNITTSDSRCKPINSREHFKREQSIDIEDSICKENPSGEREDLGDIRF